jgi:hypothetical protein
MCDPSTGEIVACTSQNAGVPVEAFAGIDLDEETEAPEIGADVSALHESCADTPLDAANPIIAMYAMTLRAIDSRWMMRIEALAIVRAGLAL